MDNKLKLHEAIEIAIKDVGPSRAKEIAVIINSRNLYKRKDGYPVRQGQISARTNNYPNLFYRNEEDGKIHLVASEISPKDYSPEEIVKVLLRYSNAHKEKTD